MKDISRRSFIALSAVGTIALATGCGDGKSAERTQKVETAVSNQTQSEDQNMKSKVFMTRDISPAGLEKVYQALNANPRGKVAVKISSGEPPASNYLRPELIGDFVKSVKGTIVECNTMYGGYRGESSSHYKVIEDHGFTKIAPVDIMDEDDSITLPVSNGKAIKENYVGSHFENYDYFIILSHFKGHQMAGFGGAIKNISIGIASSKGKGNIHRNNFIDAMAEAAKSVADALNGNMLCINVMNRISLDCDCDGHPREPEIKDIGILASYDPVALDKACVDLIYSAPDGQELVEQIERKNAPRTIEHAEEIGLGSTKYELISVD